MSDDTTARDGIQPNGADYQRGALYRLHNVLARLVALKDGPRDSAYYANKNEAWQAAREALNITTAPPVAEVAALRAEIERMRPVYDAALCGEWDVLRAEIAGLRAENAALGEGIADLRDLFVGRGEEITALRAQVDAVRALCDEAVPPDPGGSLSDVEYAVWVRGYQWHALRLRSVLGSPENTSNGTEPSAADDVVPTSCHLCPPGAFHIGTYCMQPSAVPTSSNETERDYAGALRWTERAGCQGCSHCDSMRRTTEWRTTGVWPLKRAVACPDCGDVRCSRAAWHGAPCSAAAPSEGGTS